ncbi:MAG TPA: hypothetical protein VFS31_17815 [Chitinophagaceae bacterium]|nr:hypothetical protein [Chitinophagaceae bacterium]
MSVLKDKDYEQVKRRIQKYIIKWKHLMWMGPINIDIDYVRGYATGELTGSAANVKNLPGWPYQDFTIEFFLAMLADYSEDDLEMVIIHELCHILVAPITHPTSEGMPEEVSRNLMEHTVTNMARAFWTAYKEGGEDAVKCATIKKHKKQGKGEKK